MQYEEQTEDFQQEEKLATPQAETDSSASKSNKVWDTWDKKEVVVTKETVIKRLTLNNLPFEIAKVFDVNKGFFYTLLGLFTNPAKIIRSFLGTERGRVANPLKYLLIVNGIVLFLILKFEFFNLGTEDALNSDIIGDDDKTNMLNESINQYVLGFWNMWVLGSIIITAFFTHLFFRRTGFNYIEQLAISAYIYSQTYILLIPFIILELGQSPYMMAYLGLYILYCTIVYTSLFKSNAVIAFIKALVINTLAIIVFYLLLILTAGTYFISDMIAT